MSTRFAYTRTCQDCGAIMHNVACNRQICDKCKKAKASAHDHKKALETAPLRHAYERRDPKSRVSADNSISAVCTRAIAAGRTYGQQVEFERREKEAWLHGKNDTK